MNTLIALGTLSAFLMSLATLYFHLDIPLNFDTAAIIMTLVLTGRFLEEKAENQATSALEKLSELAPKMAKVKRGLRFVDVEANQIKEGDEFLVRAGDTVPVDGVVLLGDSSVNEAMLTGESLPIYKGVGDSIFQATVNLSSPLTAKAVYVGEATSLSRIMRLIKQAQSSKAPIQTTADRVASLFVPLVLLISLFTFIGWICLKTPINQALLHAISVLVVSCPCALGLATPMVIFVASGLSASIGILFKDIKALEQVRKMKTLLIDKTGTLTEGKPELAAIYTDLNENEMLQMAYNLEVFETNPVAEAICKKAKEANLTPKPLVRCESIPGKGVKGLIDGITYSLGSVRFAKEEGVILQLHQIALLEKAGMSINVLFKGQEPLAYFALSDRLRKTSKEAIETLKKLNVNPVLVTGDHKKIAETIANTLKLETFFAEILPEEKGQIVKEFQKNKGVVGMVGDGINDALALQQADISFAMGSGNTIAEEVSQIVLMKNDLNAIPDAILLSRETFKKIWQNLSIAFLYNIIAIPLAAFGYISPIMAALAMSLSSNLVVLNALTLKRFKSRNTHV